MTEYSVEVARKIALSSVIRVASVTFSITRMQGEVLLQLEREVTREGSNVSTLDEHC